MRNLITLLVLLTAFLFIWFKKILYKASKNKNNYNRLKQEYDGLLQENKKLKIVNSDLKNTLDSTIALYDIAKQISKSLDIDTVFSYFREAINKYIEVSDCQFLKGEVDLSAYKDYAALPLKINKNSIGYLLANGLKEEDKDKFHILSQQFLLGIKRAVLYQEVQELAITDSLLSGVFNRRYYLERFNEELARSKKFSYVFSCLMVDIDYFKDYNDRFGHLVGDAILKELSKTIKENLRQIDIVGRYGGEEFSIILTETDKDAAIYAAERIRQAIESKDIQAYDEKLKITVSIGISTFPYDGKDIQTLIDRSDSALYQAKQTGKNKVCTYKV